MLLLIAFAFLAGVVTVLSPCILPILPIVLSSSIGGENIGKGRPIGVITGFILSFTFFTLFLSTIVRLSGISADTLRLFSVIVIAGFGLSLLLPQFQVLVEKLFSRLTRFMPTSQVRPGFGPGLLVGLSVGLLWTPCVGPILASIISLAITGSVTFDAFIITFFYALGTAIPMFLIIIGGQNALRKVPWLLANTGKIQKAFGVVMIITAIGIFYNVDRKFQSFILTTFPQYGVGLTKFEDNDMVKKELERLKKEKENPKTTSLESNTSYDLFNVNPRVPAPEIIPGGSWFGSTPLTIKSLRGKVVLIDFWTYTCINCQRTFPYLKAWHEKYSDKGLVIIGVHSPEFEFEKNPENVKKAISDFGLKYSIVQDNNFDTWNAYSNRYWPAKYLIDKDGYIRYTHFGEGAYAETEKVIQDLLKETGQKVDEQISSIDDQTSTGRLTPETYLGSARMDRKSDSPKGLPLHYFSLEGDWKTEKEYSQTGKRSSLTLHFYAQKAFLVITPKQAGDKIKVYLDGKLVNTITFDDPRLYDIVKLEEAGEHTLKLEFPNEGTQVFAFTFG